MDLIKVEFKKAIKALEIIEVRREPGNFYFENFEELSTLYPESINLTPQQSEFSPGEEYNGMFKLMTIGFYDAYSNVLDLSRLIQNVREELKENLSMPLDINLKRFYLKEVIDFYSKMESEIVEDKDGNFSYDKVKLLDFDFDQLDQKDREIYVNMLVSIKKTLRNEIQDLANIEKDFSKDQINSSLSRDDSSKINLVEKGKNSGFKLTKRNSFEINPDLYTSNPQKTDSSLDEKLKAFHEALYKNDLIRRIDFRDFCRIFTNKPIKKQIRWESDAKELYYLIKTLYDEKIIIQFKDYWKVTCNCFIVYHKKSRICTPSSIARCHKPTGGERLRRLNSVIDTLRK